MWRSGTCLDTVRVVFPKELLESNRLFPVQYGKVWITDIWRNVLLVYKGKVSHNTEQIKHKISGKFYSIKKCLKCDLIKRTDVNLFSRVHLALIRRIFPWIILGQTTCIIVRQYVWLRRHVQLSEPFLPISVYDHFWQVEYLKLHITGKAEVSISISQIKVCAFLCAG